jgi:signal transduction histidine kinase
VKKRASGRSGTTAAVPSHAASRYRGPDRRAAPTGQDASDAGVAIAAALLIVVAALFVILASRDAHPGDVDLGNANALLATACAVFALSAGYISGVRWRVVGDTSSLRAGAALFVLGISFVVTDLIPFVDPTITRDSVIGALGTALTIAALLLLALAVVTPTIDSRATLARRFAGTTLLALVLWGLTFALPGIDAVRRSSTGVLYGDGDVIARCVLVSALFALAGASFWRGHRSRSWLFTWFGLMLAGFALARLVSAFAESRADLWVAGSSLLTAVAILLALNGVSQELKLAYLTQRGRLFDTRITAEERAARLRAEQAEREERAHQARSAVLALHAATRNINRTSSRDVDERAWQAAMETEIGLLRRLVGECPSEATAAFDLGSVVRNVVVAQRFTGLSVEFVCEPSVFARGRASETAEVLQTLLDNAREHAPGARAVVTVRRRPPWVEVRVADHGPGIAEVDTRTVFERDVSTSGRGHGLGLYVGRRLMREQGGDLWSEGGDRGATFVFRLPAVNSDDTPAFGVVGLPHERPDDAKTGTDDYSS